MIGEDDYDFVVVLVVRLHVQDGLDAVVTAVPIINAVCRCNAITVDPSLLLGSIYTEMSESQWIFAPNAGDPLNRPAIHIGSFGSESRIG